MKQMFVQRVKEKEATLKEAEREASTLVWWDLHIFGILLIWGIYLENLVEVLLETACYSLTSIYFNTIFGYRL